MIDQETYRRLKAEIEVRTAADRSLLDKLRADVRPLLTRTKRIHPRATTSISLVATDGGNNSLRFDPFMVQVVRVVDSNDNELCLEVVTPTVPVADLNRRQFGQSGQPITSLGRLMAALKVDCLTKLSQQSGQLKALGCCEPRKGLSLSFDPHSAQTVSQTLRQGT
jgi:hypothetical protein